MGRLDKKVAMLDTCWTVVGHVLDRGSGKEKWPGRPHVGHCSGSCWTTVAVPVLGRCHLRYFCNKCYPQARGETDANAHKPPCNKTSRERSSFLAVSVLKPTHPSSQSALHPAPTPHHHSLSVPHNFPYSSLWLLEFTPPGPPLKSVRGHLKPKRVK